MLALQGVSAGYEGSSVIDGVSMQIHAGELVSLIGPNGAGKSTIMKAVLGFCDVYKGNVRLSGNDLTNLAPHERVALGMGYVPQGRQVFPDLTVEENLRMGGFLLSREQIEPRLREMYDLFPRLEERRAIRASFMSGGEQQMCAMARALMTRPDVLLLDEPTVGLAPNLVEQVLNQIDRMRTAEITMLMVEQNARMALEVSDRAYLVDNGTIGESSDAKDLLDSEEVRVLYLGG